MPPDNKTPEPTCLANEREERDEKGNLIGCDIDHPMPFAILGGTRQCGEVATFPGITHCAPVQAIIKGSE